MELEATVPTADHWHRANTGTATPTRASNDIHVRV